MLMVSASSLMAHGSWLMAHGSWLIRDAALVLGPGGALSPGLDLGRQAPGARDRADPLGHEP